MLQKLDRAEKGSENMNFIICEDNERDGNKIRDIIQEYMTNCCEPCKIQLVTHRFADVITYAKNNCDTENVYFLDVVFDGYDTNGFKIARQIREYDIYGYIIFITGYPELCMTAFQYKLKALDFICKNDPDVKKRIFECLDTIKKERMKLVKKQQNETIVIKSGSQYHNIELKNILYFETATLDRKIIVHTTNSKIEFYDTLKNLEKKLNKDFYRCHRAFIINTAHVKQVNTSRRDMHVVMSNGDKCLVSRKYLKGLMKYVSN